MQLHSIDRQAFGHMLLAHAAAPDDLALKCASAVTYARLEQEIEEQRCSLSDAGVQAGDLVALHVKSSLTFITLLYAVWRQGAQVMLLDSRLKQAESEALLQQYQPHYYIRSVGRQNPLAAFEERVEVEMIKLPSPQRLHNPDHALILFTSGSTGRPKAIGRRREAIIHDMYKLTAEPLMKPGDRVLTLSPLTHTYGLLNGLLQTLYVGATLYFPRNNQSAHLLETLREERITIMYGVPFHYQMLAQAPAAAPLEHLKHAISAGEALSQETHQAFYSRYRVSIGQQYGTSETGVLTMDWEGRCPESVGRPLPGVQLRAEQGELQAALPESPYLPPAGQERWHEGWFNMGDSGYVDHDGYVHVQGRSDSIKIIGGLKVNLQEVEAKLKQHPQVREVLVCLSEDNQRIEAHIEREAGLQEAELLAWCQEQMADYKLPRRFCWTPRLPRTSTGKLLRIHPHLLEKEAERLQRRLLREPEELPVLQELGALCEQQGKLLEALDLYARAERLAASSGAGARLARECERLRGLVGSMRLTKRDYAASLNKVVSIYCYGRSGTHLLKSLLDGHPQVIVTMLSGPELFKLWQTQVGMADGRPDLEALVEAIFAAFPGEFNEGRVLEEPRMNGMCALGEERDQLFTIDRVRFRQEWLEIVETAEELDLKLFYQSVHLAAFVALGGSYKPEAGELPLIVEGGIHFGTNVADTERLLALFPWTRLLYMARNPVIAFGSALNYQLKAGQATLYNLCFQLQSLFHGVPAKPEWAEQTYVVRLDDVHAQPEATLRLLCAYLGMRWEDSLLRSTFGGMKWWNSLTSELLSGFTDRTVSKTYDELLSPLDKSRLARMLLVKYRAWGYDCEPGDMKQKVEAERAGEEGAGSAADADSVEATSRHGGAVGSQSEGISGYEELEEQLKEPFRFEQAYEAAAGQSGAVRAVIYRLCMKLLAAELQMEESERVEYKALLLSGIARQGSGGSVS